MLLGTGVDGIYDAFGIYNTLHHCAWLNSATHKQLAHQCSRACQNINSCQQPAGPLQPSHARCVVFVRLMLQVVRGRRFMAARWLREPNATAAQPCCDVSRSRVACAGSGCGQALAGTMCINSAAAPVTPLCSSPGCVVWCGECNGNACFLWCAAIGKFKGYGDHGQEWVPCK
jgi:hypothetical protein